MLKFTECMKVSGWQSAPVVLERGFGPQLGGAEADRVMIRRTPPHPAGSSAAEALRSSPAGCASRSNPLGGGQPRQDDEAVVHEITEGVSAILMNAEAALRWLRRQPTDIDEIRRAIERIIDDSRRTARATKKIQSPQRS
jgi:hypothetical protein